MGGVQGAKRIAKALPPTQSLRLLLQSDWCKAKHSTSQSKTARTGMQQHSKSSLLLESDCLAVLSVRIDDLLQRA